MDFYLTEVLAWHLAKKKGNLRMRANLKVYIASTYLRKVKKIVELKKKNGISVAKFGVH